MKQIPKTVNKEFNQAKTQHGSLWVKREFAESALSLTLNEVGVINAIIQDDNPSTVMVKILYRYDDPHLKMVIAKELDRKIRNLN